MDNKARWEIKGLLSPISREKDSTNTLLKFRCPILVMSMNSRPRKVHWTLSRGSQVFRRLHKFHPLRFTTSRVAASPKRMKSKESLTTTLTKPQAFTSLSRHIANQWKWLASTCPMENRILQTEVTSSWCSTTLTKLRNNSKACSGVSPSSIRPIL